MNFLDHYYEGIASKIKSKKARHEFLIAILEYYYEGIEPDFKNDIADVGFQGIRYSLDKARAGRVGGQAKPEANGQAKSEAKAKAKHQAESVKEPKQNSGNNIGIGKGIEENIKEAGFCFAYQSLAILNEEIGQTFSELPSKCLHLLERMAERYTLDDVRKMVRYKRDEWAGKEMAVHLTPNTLFSPDHFEQYIAQSRTPEPSLEEVTIDDELERLIAQF